MRRPRHAIGPVVAPLRYAAVAAALVAGFFGLLVAVAHPVPAATALGGAVAGAVTPRLRGKLRRIATDAVEDATDAGEDGVDPSPA